MNAMPAISPAATDVEKWKRKVGCLGDRAFGPACSRWAVRALEVLAAHPGATIHANDLHTLTRKFGVPLKYITRAVATLTGLGIVSASLSGPFTVVLNADRLNRRKNAAQKQRWRIPAAVSTRLKAQSDYRCAHCGKKFDSKNLVVDHLIPLKLLGADGLGNWVILCRMDDREKWDRFLRYAIKQYQGEAVRRPLGIRFIDGFFWPVINDRVRYTRLPMNRQDVVQSANGM